MIKSTNKIWQLLLSSICYVGDKPYCIDIENKQLKATDKPFGKFVILGRQHYSENTKTYPITNKHDLKKIIHLEVASKDGITLYKISNVFENKRKVVFYQLNKKTALGNPLLIIPETILMGYKCSPNQGISYFLPNVQQQVFLANSSGTHVSSLAGGNIIDFERFCLSHGVRVVYEVELSNDSFVNRLFIGLKGLSPNILAGFRYKGNRPSTINRASIGKWGGILSIAFTVYLIAATNITNYLVENKRQELVDIRNEANIILNQRNDINKIIVDYETLKHALSVSDDGVGLWKIIHPLYKNGAKFKVIQMTGEEYRIQFESDSAISNLELLLNNSNVKGAEFASSVRKTRKGESAVITFMINSSKGS